MALDIIAELEGIIDALDAAGVDYAVCGGLAMGILAVPRMTKDIDLLVREIDVVRAKALVRSLGFDIPAKPMTFRQGSPDEQKMHRVSKLDPENRNVKVVSIDGLVSMKTRAGRPVDLRDIELLKFADGDET